MFNNLINWHKKYLNLNYRNQNIIFIYKKFPPSFLVRLSRDIPFLSPNAVKNGRVDIITISNRTYTKQLVANSLAHHGWALMTFEEFIILSESVDLSLFDSIKFVIIDNNLFDSVPYYANYQFVNLEDLDNKENNFKLDDYNIFYKFYAHSFKDADLPWVELIDPRVDLSEMPNVSFIYFFGDEILKNDLLYSKIDLLDNKSNQIRFPISAQYTKLLRDIFYNSLIKDVDLVADQSIFTNKENKDKLKILQFLFSHSEINYRLFIQRTIINRKCRDEFKKILKKYWHSNLFRELSFYKDPDISTEKINITQGAIIEDISTQIDRAHSKEDFRDIFLTAPTGAGKSLLFQIPSIYAAKKYNDISIIISPLKALMYDQVTQLKEKGVHFVEYINSDISLIERNKIINDIQKNNTSILYLSPELLLSYDVKTFIGDRNIALLVVDEAHLVTTWGRDFRVDYWYLGKYIQKLRKYLNYQFPILSLTATAVYTGINDIVFETISALNMRNPKLYIGSVRRDDIIFDIRNFQYKYNHENSKIEQTKLMIRESIKENIKSIFYFPWTNQIKLILDSLDEQMRCKVNVYYGDVDKIQKQIAADGFKNGKFVVILATKAFGMGIDISDIQQIYHHAPSGNLSDYIQEVGRVARNKNINGVARIDFCNKDLKYTKILYGLSSIKQYQIKLILQKIWGLYKKKKQRKMLVSVEDFGFIFSEKTKDLETKVKSTLLLLEKDLHKKYGYYVIMVRPKSLFSEVFACISKDDEAKFLNRYQRFVERVSSVQANKKMA